MTIQRRWGAAIGTILGSMLLAYALVANGAVGGRPGNRPGGGGAVMGASASMGGMRASAGMNAGRQLSGQQNFNATAAARPNFNAGNMGMQRGGMTGMQSGAMRSNAFAARPDLGMQRGGMPANNFQNNLAMSRPQSPITTRPPFNAQSNQFAGANLANRQNLGGLAALGGGAQSGIRRPGGLAPSINPASLTRPAGANLAGNPTTNRPNWAANRPTIAGGGNLPGWNSNDGSRIPSGRPDLGGGNSRLPDTVFKPDISNPNRPKPGILPTNPDRPGFNRPDWGNRPDRPNGSDWANRPGRPGWPNRPGGNFNGNNNWNSNNQNWNSNNRWISNRQNVFNNSPTIINNGYRPGFAMPGYGYGYQGNWGYGQQGVYDNSWQCGPGWAPAYGALHDDWCNGSWSGSGGDTSWLNAAATNWLTSWMYGSRQYDWGYSSYSNPYYSADTQSTVYNYSQPINTETPPPAQDQVATATDALDQARSAFMSGDYALALSQANKVVASLPNDPTVHQFRALALFALSKYDEASQALYPVLSVGPGWDWTTMSGLYPSEEVYENQLTKLENYVNGHPNSVSARFLLAYHYLTIGSPDVAADQLRQVVKLKPTDGLSRQMLALLDSAKKPAAVAGATPPQTSSQASSQLSPPGSASESQVPQAALVGTWSAKPDDKTSIKLTLGSDGKFTWDVNQQSGQIQLRGNFQVASGDLLTLAQDQQGGTLAGNVKLADDGRFTFKLMGAPASDPGLTFVRQL